MTTTLCSTTSIAAQRATVWNVLVDTAQYPAWNPYYVEMDGRIAVNECLHMRVSMDTSQKRTTASPSVLEVVPEERIVWRNHFLIPGLLTATHSFWLVDQDGVTALKQVETFTGVLLPVSAGAIKRVAVKLDELGACLKARCEAIAGAQSHA